MARNTGSLIRRLAAPLSRPIIGAFPGAAQHTRVQAGVHPAHIAPGDRHLRSLWLIYSCLAYIGATSVAQYELSKNGGIALAQIAHYYFGAAGSILLAIIVTLACLKTAIGLITACSETFQKLFPNSLSYRAYVILFTIVSCLIANIGLTQIISLSIPVLMFLYPLAITLIILAFLSPMFKHRQIVYVLTTVCTLFASVGDAFNAMPDVIKNESFIQNLLAVYHSFLPFFDIGMGWVIPMVVGLSFGWFIGLFQKNSARSI